MASLKHQLDILNNPEQAYLLDPTIGKVPLTEADEL